MKSVVVGALVLVLVTSFVGSAVTGTASLANLPGAELSGIRGGADCAQDFEYMCEGGPSTCAGPGCDASNNCVIQEPGLVTHHNWWYECRYPVFAGLTSCNPPILMGCNEIVACGPACNWVMSIWVCPEGDYPYEDDTHWWSLAYGPVCGGP